ncbi:hypothetical protein [Actinokineospora sp. HUAS TT18]|uniref:hypothetical protein n=1 Tax=Actinokineospora sp. HUAS TT18 TaxID=3447451 RepID=UPI003F51F990
MRPFLDRRRGEGVYEPYGPGRVRETSCYLEFEFPLGDADAYAVLYMTTKTLGKEIYLQANVDEVFAGLIWPPFEVHEHREVFLRELVRIRPVFAQVVAATARDRFDPAQFLFMLDPDVGSSKLFVTTALGNISDTDPPDRLNRAIVGLATLTYDLLVELTAIPVNVNRVAALMTSADVRRGVNRALRWVDANKEVLINSVKPF